MFFIERMYQDKMQIAAEYFGENTVISFHPVSDPTEVTTSNYHPDNFLTIANLYNGEWIFSIINSITGKTLDKQLIEFTNYSKQEYFNQVFNLSDEKQAIIARNITGDYYIEELYKDYLNNKNADYTETYKTMLTALINDFNNTNNYLNGKDELDIRFSNDYVISIDLSRNIDYFVNDAGLIQYLKIDYNDFPEKNKELGFTWDNSIQPYGISIDTHIQKFNLEPGLYKFYILAGGDIRRCYYFFVEDQETKNQKFQEIIENKQKIANEKIDSRAILESEYNFESEEEKEIVMNIEYLNDWSALLPKPVLEYENGNITFTATDFNSLSMASKKPLYLYGFEEDTIYNGAVPHKVLIDSDVITFNRDKKFFNRERYYFYVGDEDKNKISRVTTLDLSGYNDTGIDYNERYEHLVLNTHIKKFNKFLSSYSKWSEVKSAFDRYNQREDIAFEDVLTVIESEALTRLNYSYDKAEQLVYNYELCLLKNYTNKNRDLAKEQVYKSYYSTHVIPQGNYILMFKYICNNGTNIIYAFDDTSLTQAAEFEIGKTIPKLTQMGYKTNDFIIVKAIDINTWKVSDFIMYNNTGYGVKSFYNTIEVETINGL